jgi:hypothetical protein
MKEAGFMSWRVVGASAPGTYHMKKNIYCQDAFGYKVLPRNVVVMAVADGAGFASRCEEGAKLAVDKIINLVSFKLQERMPVNEFEWRAMLTAAFIDTIDAIKQLAEKNDVHVRSFSTTLTCAIASDECLSVAQIGDGAVIAETLSGELFLAVQPQRGEYANQSIFISMPNAINYLDIRTYSKPVKALALTTDGLLRLALNLPDYRPHVPFFVPLMSFVMESDGDKSTQNQLYSFLCSERVCSRTDDDKTLVLAVRSTPFLRKSGDSYVKNRNKPRKVGDVS